MYVFFQPTVANIDTDMFQPSPT